MKHPWALGALCLISLFSGTACAGVLADGAKPRVRTYRAPTKRLDARAATLPGTPIDRSTWTIKCDTTVSTTRCDYAIDGDPMSIWHSSYDNGVSQDSKLPHTLTVDMKVVQNVNGVSVQPRQDGGVNGRIKTYQLYLSRDGNNWGKPASLGMWKNGAETKLITLETTRARYVRLVALSEQNGNQFSSVAEFNVFKADSYNLPNPGLGQWGPTLAFTVVPASGFVDPVTGKVWVLAANTPDGTEDPDVLEGQTEAAIWDPAKNSISAETINTGHNMYGASISTDEYGQVMFAGGGGDGGNGQGASLFSPLTTWWPWQSVASPRTERGFQSSTITSQGRIFTVGGARCGGAYEKDGELYAPNQWAWGSLGDIHIHPMLTADSQGITRADNHGWLFGWKKGSVFQAGPSTAMNWYYSQDTPSGIGDIKSAGNRQPPNADADPDAMCGNAVMYDAVKGKILTFGGSPQYEGAAATDNARLITIGEPGVNPSVALAGTGKMHYPRTYHTSVVLPDGTTFITGGMAIGDLTGEDSAQLVPELYDPATNQFVTQTPNSIKRPYNSISLLLPDGRVFNGGGGLCGSCDINHFDAQIFTPSYLLGRNGALAPRPKILSVSPAEGVQVGGKVVVKTASAVKGASLIRYGATAHGINTDQRRIPLTLKKLAANKYQFTLPNDLGIVLPGYYMLFVIDSTGTPSISKNVRVST